MEHYNQPPKWLLLNFGLLWKTVTSVLLLLWNFCLFMTVGPGGKDTGEVAKEERKSDLGEKERISGEIKVKASLCELTEMSAAQKTHSQVDRPGRTWASQHEYTYMIIRNTQKQND